MVNGFAVVKLDDVPRWYHSCHAPAGRAYCHRLRAALCRPRRYLLAQAAACTPGMVTAGGARRVRACADATSSRRPSQTMSWSQRRGDSCRSVHGALPCDTMLYSNMPVLAATSPWHRIMIIRARVGT